MRVGSLIAFIAAAAIGVWMYSKQTGKYLTLAELRAKGVSVPERRGPYVYSAEVGTGTFTISATYTGQGSAPTLTIGPDMQVR